MQEVMVVTYPLDASAGGWQGDDVVGHLFRAPATDKGGPITILEAYAVNGAATTAGTSFDLALENWGTAGTAKVADVATAIGGTADPWAANTPKDFAIVEAQKTLDAGEYLVLRKTETNSSDPTRGVVTIHYGMGV